MENTDIALENYFLGWMYSDGCIRYIPEKYIYVAKIKLKNDTSEKKVLQLFSNYFKSSFYDYEKDVIFANTRKKFVESLIKKGLYQDKSGVNKEKMYLPKLSDSQMNYFLRGLYEGDGNFDYNNKTLLMNTTLYCNSLSFCEDLKNYLFDKLGIKSNLLYRERTTGSCYSLKISKNDDVYKFISNIYFDRLDIVLDRKYNTAKKFIDNYIDTNTRLDIRKNIIKKLGSNIGRIMSLETKQKQSLARKGVKWTEEKRKKYISTIRKNTTNKIEVFYDSVSIGVFCSCSEIEEISYTKYFEKYIHNKKGRIETPYYVLKNKNINYSLLHNKPYKNLTFKYFI